MITSVVHVHPGRAVTWVAYDLMEGESFTLYYSVSPPSDKAAKFVPFCPKGIEVHLSEDMPMTITAIPGYYQVVPDAPVVRAKVSVSDPYQVTPTVEIA